MLLLKKKQKKNNKSARTLIINYFDNFLAFLLIIYEQVPLSLIFLFDNEAKDMF